MESKFKLRLDRSIDINTIGSATVLCLSSEYLIDLIKDVFKKHNDVADIDKFLDEFTGYMEGLYDVSFTSFNAWIVNKTSVFMSILNVVSKLDEHLTSKGVISKGELSNSLQTDFNEFVMSLGSIIVDWETLDLNGATIKQDYIDSTIEQLSLMNESYVLCSLVSNELEMTPIDTKTYQNSIIENKLKSLNKVTSSAKKTFDGDYDKLLDLIMSMYGKFYKISNEKITDGEKVEKARNLVKDLNLHKKVLDKLENKLTKGNELKRQLTLSKTKLQSNMRDEVARLDAQINEDNENADIYQSKKDSIKLITEEYTKAIESEIKNINELEEEIAKRYKMLDLLNSSLKSSIPTEGEMKKLSAIPFKFQELSNKLENAKSTIADKNIKELISTMITGLKSLVAAGEDLKELYMRNSLVSANFKTIDVILDFAESDNKGEQLKQFLALNSHLDKYSKVSLGISEDFFKCRTLANNTIRNIALTMCKNYTKTSLKEISKQIETCYQGMDEYLDRISDNNKHQINIVKEILSL